MENTIPLLLKKITESFTTAPEGKKGGTKISRRQKHKPNKTRKTSTPPI